MSVLVKHFKKELIKILGKFQINKYKCIDIGSAYFHNGVFDIFEMLVMERILLKKRLPNSIVYTIYHPLLKLHDTFRKPLEAVNYIYISEHKISILILL